MEIFHKKLLEAFRTDCQTLITRFELSYNTHFQNFCDTWKEMQFSLIFNYFPPEICLATICEDFLCVIKQFLVNATSVKERIGALYLMYAVYYKMPVKQIKIRMTMSDWNCLMDLHQYIKAEEYLDSNYILCRLIVDRAFVHCVSDNKFGIEKHFYTKQTKPALNVNLMPEIKELAAPGKLLSTISKLSKAYEEKKASGNGTSCVQLYDPSVADDIANSIRAMQSQSRIFAKSTSEEVAGCSKRLVPSTSTSTSDDQQVTINDSQKIPKRMRFRKTAILSKIGRAFEKGLESDSEDLITEIDPLGGI